MSYVGIIFLVIVFVVIAALANGRRAGIFASIAGLGFVAMILVCGAIYGMRSAEVRPPPAPLGVMWSGPDAGMSVSWQGDTYLSTPPIVAQAKWITFFPLLFLGGAVAAILFFTMFRRSGGAACAAGHQRAWWPVALLLLFIPLGLFFLVGRTHVDRQATAVNRFDAEMHARQIQEQVARQQAELARQQRELAQRAGELNNELEHRIATMDIHKLMDLVDAPRIMLPIPTPATIAQWAHLATAEQPPAEATSVAGSNQTLVEPEAEVQAEADAAVQLIATEAETVPPAASAAQSTAPISDSHGSEGQASSRSVEPARTAPVEESTDPRPSWVQQAPKRVGNVRRDVIATDEYSSREECEWAADRLLQLKTYEHLQRLVGNPFDADQAHQMRNHALSIEGHTPWFVHELEKAGITIDYMHHEIARDEYLEEVERSFGKMLKLYTQIEFTPAVENELRRLWQISKRQERFAAVGLGASSVFGLLGLAWGLLKVDTWTKGYYTKRLFIGVPLAVIGTVGLYNLLIAMGFDLPH